jgi:L-alanine-DL-glutamate epimerase-like enolase superfamily enzyme
MIIKNFDTKHYRIPLPTTMSDSMHGAMSHFEVIMVLLESEDGTRGLGYTYTIGLGGAAIKSLLDEAFKPLLIGENPRNIEHHWEKMWWQLHYIGRGGLVSFAISAVDIALWDMVANKDGVPLWQMLGGSSPLVKPYAGGIDLHLDIDGLLDQTRKNLDYGFRAIKMKVGLPHLGDDIERVAVVRELLGPDIPLMVDANMRWNVETAIRAARKLQEFDVYWLEEPTIPDDVQGHARIAVEGGLPLASGENLHTIYEFQKIITDGMISFPEPDVSNCCGITGWMRVAKLAYAHNLPVTTHGVHEIHLHLLAAVPNASYLEVHGFGLEHFIHNPPEIVDGIMIAPNQPGHSVHFDWDTLKKFEQQEKR